MTKCDPKSWRLGAAVPSYLPPYVVDYNSFDPTKDLHQLKVLQDANVIIGSKAIFEGFVNSAPDWMLGNNCSQGTDATDNLKQEMASD
jgi:hypothetical protein